MLLQVLLAEPAARYLLHDTRAILALQILAPSLPFMAAAGAVRGCFLAARRVHPNVIAQLIEQIIRMAIAIAALRVLAQWGAGYGCAAVVLGSTVSEGISCALMFAFAAKTPEFARRADEPLQPYTQKELYAIVLPVEGSRLLASGRQNVLYLYNSMSFSGRNKLAGYREGYADAGRSAPEGLALMLDAYRFDVAQVRELLARKWDAGARFDAVLAADDRLAVGAAKFAKLRGLRIPQDLSIIGCNNSPIARYCDPELTSIDNRLGDLCASCVDGLMAVLEGKPCPADAALPAALVERESTDLPKEE